MPERIQIRHESGWRKPEGAIIVARPSRWGNFYVVRRNWVVDMPERRWHYGDKLIVARMQRSSELEQWGTWRNDAEGRAAAHAFAVDLYRRTLEALVVEPDGPLRLKMRFGELRGHDLACHCPLDQACHADVLLELINA